jgi:small subunit ribosomal protein S10
MKKNKFTLIIKSPCIYTLKSYVDYLDHTLNKLNLKSSCFFFPKKENKITLLRSPHVFKKSKEQFKITTYKALVQIKSFLGITLNKKLIYILLNRPKLIVIKIK